MEMARHDGVFGKGTALSHANCTNAVVFLKGTNSLKCHRLIMLLCATLEGVLCQACQGTLVARLSVHSHLLVNCQKCHRLAVK